jgi:four helix bundle protein
MYKNDLEDRLIQFSISVIQVAEQLENSKTGNTLKGQLVRSSSSASLNYGEAQSAESRKDFIHKLKVVLKELRETNAGLKILEGLKIFPETIDISPLLKEANELISIFVRSVQTATRNDAIAKKMGSRK